MCSGRSSLRQMAMNEKRDLLAVHVGRRAMIFILEDEFEDDDEDDDDNDEEDQQNDDNNDDDDE